MTRRLQIERSIQAEIVLRLRAWPVKATAVPNSIWLPLPRVFKNGKWVKNPIVGQIIGAMKRAGMLTPGACDLILQWAGGRSACVEIKRPASSDLLTERERGRLSPDQVDYRADCERLGIPYVEITSWAELEWWLGEWGIARPGVVVLPHEEVVT